MTRIPKTVRLGALVLAVAAALVLASACQKASEKSAEKMIANAIEKAGGGKADVDLKDGKVSIKTSEGAADLSIEDGKMSVKTDQGTAEFSAEAGQWPADLPGDVPKMEAGKVTTTLRGSQGEGKTWTIGMTDVAEADYAKYVEKLKAEGFEIIMNMSVEDGAMTQAKKGTTVVNLTLGKSAKSLALSVMSNFE